MECFESFLQKHRRLQAFNDVWKALPPYPGFFVPRKPYREVSQWQGKEMRNLGRCLLGVLAAALAQPDQVQVAPFRRVLVCVRSLLDFSLMAQYRSHTPETLEYMNEYLRKFHATNFTAAREIYNPDLRFVGKQQELTAIGGNSHSTVSTIECYGGKHVRLQRAQFASS